MISGATDKTDKAVEHRVDMRARRGMDIQGVKDVESFDEEGASLITVCGRLTVEGENIKINVLDLERGIVSIGGRIDALYYSEAGEGEKKGFFSRMFK